jgi:hypothetical protein
MSIIFHRGKKWKDFLKAFPLDPPDPQQFLRSAETAHPPPLRDDGRGHRRRDARKAPDLGFRCRIYIQTFSKEKVLMKG